MLVRMRIPLTTSRLPLWTAQNNDPVWIIDSPECCVFRAVQTKIRPTYVLSIQQYVLSIQQFSPAYVRNVHNRILVSHSTDVIYLIYSKYRRLRFPYVRHLHGMHVSEGMRSHEARGKILFGGVGWGWG